MPRTVDLIPSRLRRTIAKFRDARLIYVTERTLRALPEHIRRDIGWPDNMQDRRFRK